MIPGIGNSLRKLSFGSNRREGVFQRWKDLLLYTVGGGTEPEWAPQRGCECTVHTGRSISMSFFFFTPINISPHVLESFQVNGWKSLRMLLIGVSDL